MGQALDVVVVSAYFMARHEGPLPAGSFGTIEHESRNVIICGQQTVMILVYTTNLYLAQFISLWHKAPAASSLRLYIEQISHGLMEVSTP